MSNLTIRENVLTVCVLLWITIASCQPLNNLEVSEAWVRATPPSHEATAAYLIIKNHSNRAWELLSVETPAAQYTELHTMRYVNNIMEMAKIGRLQIPPHGETVLKPGGNHLMLFGVNRALAEGDTVNLILSFSDQRDRTVKAVVFKGKRSDE